MKKLKLINHLGETEVELDVYVDGQSLDWRSPKLKAIWLSRIVLQDPDESLEEEASPISEEKTLTEIPSELEEVEKDLNQEGLTLKTLEVVPSEEIPELWRSIKRECEKCGWTGTQGECGYGHNDFYCPVCKVESLKEVTDEPETTGDKSPRKRRSRKTDTSKDSKELPKKPTIRKSSKRSK